jgi:hypothetical protein
MRSYICFIALAMLASPAFADPDHGTIRLCRDTRFTSLGDHQPIVIPAGSQFVQDLGERIGTEIRVSSDTGIGPKPSCAIAQAVIVDRPLYAPRLTGSTVFLAQFTEPSAELKVRIVGGFK